MSCEKLYCYINIHPTFNNSFEDNEPLCEPASGVAVKRLLVMSFETFLHLINSAKTIHCL